MTWSTKNTQANSYLPFHIATRWPDIEYGGDDVSHWREEGLYRIESPCVPEVLILAIQIHTCMQTYMKAKHVFPPTPQFHHFPLPLLDDISLFRGSLPSGVSNRWSLLFFFKKKRLKLIRKGIFRFALQKIHYFRNSQSPSWSHLNWQATLGWAMAFWRWCRAAGCDTGSQGCRREAKARDSGSHSYSPHWSGDDKSTVIIRNSGSGSKTERKVGHYARLLGSNWPPFFYGPTSEGFPALKMKIGIHGTTRSSQANPITSIGRDRLAKSWDLLT